MTTEKALYTRFNSKNRDPTFLYESGRRQKESPSLYQIQEGVLGYSDEIDLTVPPTIIVHPLVCDIQRYKPFIENHKGLIIILEEDHELCRTLNHFDSLQRFRPSLFSQMRSLLRRQSKNRLDNFLYIPTANNNPKPMWGLTDSEYYYNQEKVNILNKTSWSRLTQFVQSLRMGKNESFQISNYDPSIQNRPVRLAGGYWPRGCAAETKEQLEFDGISVEPIESLMYFTARYRD